MPVTKPRLSRRVLTVTSLLLLQSFTHNIHKATATSSTNTLPFDDIISKYQNWLLMPSSLSGQLGTSNRKHEHVRWSDLKNTARRTLITLKTISSTWPSSPSDDLELSPYDTRIANGDDRREVEFLVTQAIPNLATAYHLGDSDSRKKHKRNPYKNSTTISDHIVRIFQRLHNRGFKSEMHMPHKVKEVKDDPLEDKAFIVDFHLRTSGFALGTFLMRGVLEEEELLEDALETCAYVMTQGQKFGDPRNLHLNADAIRVATNFALPFALASRNQTRLQLYASQVQHSMSVESNVVDTIKPDGMGFHHQNAYMSGYSPYGVKDAAFGCWLLAAYPTLKCPGETLKNLLTFFETVDVISYKYDMHKGLWGRLRQTRAIPKVLLGYFYVADLADEFDDDDDAKSAVRMFVRRGGDEALFDKPMVVRQNGIFAGFRDENPPGPGAVDSYMTLAKRLTDDYDEEEIKDPEGHWSFSYGPHSVHRREGYMVGVKGYSKYFWAFERSTDDALGGVRLQNILGFHDSSFYIQIHVAKGDNDEEEAASVEGSGYAYYDGWDWSRIPGATTRLIPIEKLYALDKAKGQSMNRPRSHTAFVGGVHLNNTDGIFVMDYEEVTVEKQRIKYGVYDEGPLRAMKSMFCFGDEIIVLTDSVRDNHGDEEYRVGTTIFQTALETESTPTYSQGVEVTELGEEILLNRTVRLVDAVGNAYYIPNATNVTITRSRQTSRGYTGENIKQGLFATAWYDHSTNPTNDSFYYVILPNKGKDILDDYDPSDNFHIVTRTDDAIIIHHKPSLTTGYVVMSNHTDISDGGGIIKNTTAPCLIMTKTNFEDGEAAASHVLHMSITNPDLGWDRSDAGERYAIKNVKETYDTVPTEPYPTPLTVTMYGYYALVVAAGESSSSSSSSNVTIVSSNENQTTIDVGGCADGMTVEFELQCVGSLDICKKWHVDKSVYVES